MVQIDVAYKGQLRCTATHGPSGTSINTDAPKDNMGKGEAFSPTDLVATALATCMVTTMGISAQRHNINIEGTTATVGKEMTAVPVRRIARLTVQITVPTELSEDDRHRMRNAAMSCPVHKSLHPDVKIPVTFYWGRERKEDPA
ncbi:MAG TPA: OsmC family protein [Tepidisphaeraceae bacterium]|nr:OsmC family protein [Tepidisphaeraceae bacterium]